MWTNPTSDISIKIPFDETQIKVSLTWTVATLLRKIKSNIPLECSIIDDLKSESRKEEYDSSSFNDFLLTPKLHYETRPLFSFTDGYNKNLELDFPNLTVSDLAHKRIRLFGSRVSLETFSFKKQSLTWRDHGFGFGSIGTESIPRTLPLTDGLYILLRDVVLGLFWFKSTKYS